MPPFLPVGVGGEAARFRGPDGDLEKLPEDLGPLELREEVDATE